MNHSELHFPGIPVFNIFTGLDFTHTETLFDTLKVMLEPVGYKNGLSVCSFDKVFQRIKLSVMQTDGVIVFIVDCTISHLQKLSGKHRSICCINLCISKADYHIFLQDIVLFPFFGRKLYPDLVYNLVRHIKVIACLHGYSHVGNKPIYFFLCSRSFLIGEYHNLIAFVRFKEPSPVIGNVSTKPCSAVKQTKLCP